MDIAQATLLKQNGNILTPNMAQGLNEQYETNAFKAGQQMSYGVENGKLANVSLSNKVDDLSVAGYNINGGRAETTLNDDMQPVLTTYQGNINGFEGSLTTDGHGNAINFNGSQGSNTQTNDTHAANVGNSLNIGNATMEAVKRGDLNGIGGYLYNKDGDSTNMGKAAMTNIARELDNLYSKSMLTNTAGNIKIGLGNNISASAYIQASEDERVNMLSTALYKEYEALGADKNLTNEERLNSLGGTIGGVFNNAMDKGDDGVVHTLVDKGADKVQETFNDIKEFATGKVKNVIGKSVDKLVDNALENKRNSDID